MELIFVRHGQPEWERDGRSLIDPPLTDLGRTQAARLGEAARSWRAVDAIFVSPMRRARETAEPLCLALAKEPITIPWFAEIGLPASWEGAPAQLVGEWLTRARHRTVDEWWEGLPGGETFRDFWARITTNLAHHLAELGATRPTPEAHPSVWQVQEPHDRRYVFVGHGGANSVALSFLLGIEPVPWAWERFVSHHASVSRVKSSSLLDGRVFGLRAMSDVAHLPPELQTR
ncbi:histidine phosphatase family protein [Myxococcota bacterium]|nr:histidine phosphatase family protein [Myxococcota bacterium]